MKLGNLVTLFVVMIVAFSGCKKDDPPFVDLGYEYFPVNTGSWIEYQVDSLWRDDTLQILDSVSYRLLERIYEDYTDDEGRIAQRILRYTKNADDEWIVRDVWTGTRSNTAAERMEENLRRLKLSFPTRNNRTWDMNIYNTEAELEVNYKEVDTPYTLNGFSFDSTLVVRNKVGPNAVIKRNFDERYAKHVGMIKKYWEETNTQTQFPPNGPPIARVRGFRLNMEMVAYGND